MLQETTLEKTSLIHRRNKVFSYFKKKKITLLEDIDEAQQG